MTAIFWVAALAIMGCYAFFVMLGAWDPAEVLPLTIAVAVMGAMWLGRAWLLSHRATDGRDARLIRQRERRGF